jgi:hypothetical protein
MKNKARHSAALLAVAVSLGTAGASHAYTQHFNKVVSLLEVQNAACYFFQLDGVSVVDSSISTTPWFAIPRNSENAKELYALILSAKLTGTPLSRVLTSGSLARGQSEVLTIDL